MCNLCQQRPCRGDLGHFRRRREAFERRAESGVSVGVAAVCAIELGERQRGAQFEAAGFLGLCDGDGGKEGVFGGGRIGRIALQKDLAADAISLRFESSLSGAFDFFERSIKRHER